MPLGIGITFVNKPTATLSSHLWIIISDTFGSPEKVVIVNLTTWRDRATELNDASCIVNIGDHRFVTGKSYISYFDAKCRETKALQEALNKGLITLDETCSDGLLVKILAGAAKSPFTPIKVLQALQDQELV